MRVLALILLSLAANATAQTLRVGAFNVKVFGVSKMDKPDVVDVLVEICKQYDIIMIQEIRDSGGESFPTLVSLVNAASPYTYEYVIGPRVGRTSSKEQYGYMYRAERVRVSDQWQYDDKRDVFEREPYVVEFERTTSSGIVDKFTYASLHAKPDDAVAELDAMDDVYNAIKARNGENSLLMGDFNADCSYVTSSEFDQITLWTDPKYTWMIGHSADTTVSSTHCAYDRVVRVGSILDAYVSQASVYYFDADLRLSYDLVNFKKCSTTFANLHRLGLRHK